MSPPTLALDCEIASSTCCERDVVLPQQLGVEQDLVLLDRAAEAGHVDDAGDRLERRFEHPVLHRLELVERVAGPFQHVADDLAGRAPGRERRA